MLFFNDNVLVAFSYSRLLPAVSLPAVVPPSRARSPRLSAEPLALRSLKSARPLLHPCHPPNSPPPLRRRRSAQRGFNVAECASEDSSSAPQPPSSFYLLHHHVFLVTLCRWCCVSKWIMCIVLFHSQPFPSFREGEKK